MNEAMRKRVPPCPTPPPQALPCSPLPFLTHGHPTFLQAPQNVCIVSIPSLFDPAMAPSGKAVVHAYTAGNEPWEIWENVKPGTPEYEQLKVGCHKHSC